MLKNYKDLKVWQRSYQLCLDIYKLTKGKQALEPLNPGILESFLATKLEKNLKFNTIINDIRPIILYA